MDNLEEMDKFLKSYKLPRLSHEEIGNLNRPITSKEIKRVTKNKSSGPGGFTGKFSQTFEEDLIPSLPKLFSKIEEERMFTNSFYEVNITLITKPDKNNTQKIYRPISI